MSARGAPIFGPRERLDFLELEEMHCDGAGLSIEDPMTGDGFQLTDDQARRLRDALERYLRHRQMVRGSAAYRELYPYVKP